MALQKFQAVPETLRVRILIDKLELPSELAPRVSRERLLAVLRESLNSCAATVVNGRSGTGKTSLAVDFARTAGRRVAWYKVEAADDQLPVFFQYLCAGVRGQRPGFGGQTAERCAELQGVEDVPLLVEYFVHDLLQENEPLLIVLDDLHLVYDAEWVVPFFRRLLPLLPPEVHVMLVSRSLPPAPLWRMRSKQTLHVIDEPELAFTVPEARRLFGAHGLSDIAACQAWERTRGRAGLLDECARLAAAGLREESREARHNQLRLVKGFMSEPGIGTA